MLPIRQFAWLFLVLCTTGQVTAQLSYTLHSEANPTEDQLDAYSRIQSAMDSSLVHYNGLTTLTKSLHIYYAPGVPTAEANFDGTIRFGSSRSYMSVITAMHEIAHTLGIGTTNEYKGLVQGGVFTGKSATRILREITEDDQAVLKGDQTHFWPYGLNYSSEVKSEEDLIRHCKIVDAIVQDLFQETLYFTGRIRSQESKKCLVRMADALSLGSCMDSSSILRIVQMGVDQITYRMQFGNLVLDTPNESKASGITIGLYTWNGKDHQKFLLENQELLGAGIVRIRMVHSGLYLVAQESSVTQESQGSLTDMQYWELLPLETPSQMQARKPARILAPQSLHGSFDLLGRIIR